MVERETPRVLGDHDERGARHGALDAQSGREALDEAGLARPEVAAQRHHGAGRRAPAELGGQRVGRLGARRGDGDRASRRRGHRRAGRLAHRATVFRAHGWRMRRIAPGMRVGHVAREETGLAPHLRREVPRQAVEVDRRDQHLGRRDTLCEQPSRDAREHVAGASGRHPGIARRVHGHPAVGTRHHGPRALQRDVSAALGRQAPRAPHPVGLDVRDPAAEEPRRLARVRRQEPGRRSLAAERQPAGERGQGIGVHDHGALDVTHQGLDGGLRLRIEADPGAEGHCVHAREELHDPLHRLPGERPRGGLREGLRHGLEEVACHYGLLGCRRRARHESRAGPEGAEAGEHRRAGPPDGARHDEEMPVGPLVGIHRPRGQDRPHVGRLGQARRGSTLEPRAWDAQVDDLHAAGARGALRRDQRDLRQPEGHGDARPHDRPRQRRRRPRGAPTAGRARRRPAPRRPRR